MFDVNLKVPLSTVTTTLSRYAKRATTATEKKYLYEIAEALGTAIPNGSPGFHEEFLKECGISPSWANVAA
jgi:hypothetical protein